MDEKEAREYLKSVDPSVAQSLVADIVEELEELAARVSAYGLAEGARKALGSVAQMGAELAAGACLLFNANRWYSGAALVRQLIEVEYLLYLFATDVNEADQWLKASEEQVRAMFSPGNMRKRTNNRFDANEYSLHCKYGGHPRFAGSVFLREQQLLVQSDSIDSRNPFDPAVLWVDLAQHVERMWNHYVVAVTLISPSNVYPERFDKVNARIAAWHAADVVPPRI
jgi:hypothetical protein